MAAKTTPMLRQYLAIKEEHPDCLLFFRMGDFYELFFEDAKVASAALEITLTSRGRHQGEPIPMCGVPHHAAGSYIARLIEAGFKVAICDQVEDPAKAKGLVRREVVQVVSQGTFTDPEHLPAKENTFLAAADPNGLNGKAGLAFLDLSTGQFAVRETDGLAELAAEISRLSPAELLLPGDFRDSSEFNTLAGLAGVGPGRSIHVEFLDRNAFDRRKAARRLVRHFNVPDLKALEVDHLSAGLSAAGAILAYVAKTAMAAPKHIVGLEVISSSAYLQIDDITARHLELFSTLTGRRGKGTLIHVLDKTMTAMGGRLLRRWLAYPLKELEPLRRRQAMVAALFEAPGIRSRLRESLRRVADLERLCGRIVMERATPREVFLLKVSARALPDIKALVEETGSPELVELGGRLDPLTDLAEMIDQTLIDDPPTAIKEGGIIKPGFDAELDELTRIKADGQGYIAALEERERERTGIASLKVKYNKVFGYYLEVSKANLDKVPDDYRRKQTLVNAERFTTEELDSLEEKVLTAGEKAAELEHRLFAELRGKLAEQAPRIKDAAAKAAFIDVVAGLAEVAQANDYCRPALNDSETIELIGSRHPVVEVEFTEEPFVPNDIRLDMTDQQVLILTGPNMAGKSTILRQAALGVLMAQMGACIPAERASIGLVDRIFTRVGAGDELARGRSTFMVEMSETARILTQATPQSLVVLDEIGRGTSTFDGLAIAWAVTEFLHDLDGRGVKTLLATHYHELIELAAIKERVKNFTVAVKKLGQRVVFLRTLTPGGVSRSYGLEVAHLAGLPVQVIARAREVLAGLEEGAPKSLLDRLEDPEQPLLFSAGARPDVLRQRLSEIDPDQTTPLEALSLLAELKELI